MQNNECFNLLAHQIEHENTLGKLYKVYSMKFPEEEVWKTLAAEEKKHASMVQQLIGKVTEETICLNTDPEKCVNIKESIERLKHEINKAEDEDIDLLYAFKTGMEFEEGIIEREFFSSMETDAMFVEDILEKIILDTEKHRDTLIDAKNNYIHRIESGQVKENTIPPSPKQFNKGAENPEMPDEEIDLKRNIS